MGGCQNYGPFLGSYYNTAPIIQGTQKGTLILTTTHIINCMFGTPKPLSPPSGKPLESLKPYKPREPNTPE